MSIYDLVMEQAKKDRKVLEDRFSKYRYKRLEKLSELASRADIELDRRRDPNRNHKKSILEQYEDAIKNYLQMGLMIKDIREILNKKLPNPITYQAYRNFISRNDMLNNLWKNQPKVKDISKLEIA